MNFTKKLTYASSSRSQVVSLIAALIALQILDVGMAQTLARGLQVKPDRLQA